jgi:hypothetical protein
MPFAVVGAAATIGGAIISSNAADSASKRQAQGAANAQAAQDRATQWAEGNQQPFIDEGVNALALQRSLIDRHDSLLAPYQAVLDASTPGKMTQAELEATPGYQFTLNQGLRATENSASAKGLGVSGAALKGAAAWATGLADQTYNTRFNQQQQIYNDRLSNMNAALANNQQTYNQISGLTGLGGNVSVQAGTQANQGAANSGSIATGLGNSQGAADIAGGNALAGGFTGAANAFQQQRQYNLMQQYLNGGGGGGGNPYLSAGNWWSGANGSALGQYANPYGATGSGQMIVGSSGMMGGGV